MGRPKSFENTLNINYATIVQQYLLKPTGLSHLLPAYFTLPVYKTAKLNLKRAKMSFQLV